MNDLSLNATQSPPEIDLFAFTWEGKSHAGTAAIFWKDGFLSCNGRLGTVGKNQCYHLTLGASASVLYPPMHFHRAHLAYTIYQGRLWVTGGHQEGNLASESLLGLF